MDKDRVIELVDIFGLYVDLDRWEEKGFLRIEDATWKDFRPLIIYKEDVEKSDKTFVQEELQNYLLSLGEYNFKKKLNSLLSINNDK